MIFSRSGRPVTEKMFIIGLNNQGTVMNRNATCQLDMSTAMDGVRISYVSAGQQFGFMGIVDQNIPIADYGLVQVYGYRPVSNVLQSSVNLAAGMPLTMVTGQQYLAQVDTSAASSLPSIWVVAMQSSTSGTGSASPAVFIRAL